MIITENDLKRMVAESVNRILSEVSTDTKGAALVKARQELQRLQNLGKQGEKYIQKNGQTVNVQSEIQRLKRQIETFRTGVNVDLNYKYGKDSAIRRYETYLKDLQDKEEIDQDEIDDLRRNFNRYYDYDSKPNNNPYNLEFTGDDGNNYHLRTPYGGLQTTNYGTERYSNDDRGGQSALDKFQSQLDALKGYDDSLSHATDAEIDDLDRVQQNYIDIKNYEKDHDKWEEQNREIKQKQADYDRSPFFKKWGKKRPEDIPEPKAPKWRTDKSGHYDGYFRDTDPEFYNGEKERVRNAQKGYRDAYNKKSRNYI